MALTSAGVARAAQGAFEVSLIEPAEHLDVAAGSTVPVVWESGNAPAALVMSSGNVTLHPLNSGAAAI